MKRIAFLLTGLIFLASCDKHTEKAAKLTGIWEIEETVVTTYSNNEPQAESTIEQTGVLQLEASGGLDNFAHTNISFAPCLAECYWDIPKRKTDQIFFYKHDEDALSIYTNSCMLEKLTNKKLVILKVAYDNELNIQQTTRWKFRRGKL